MLRPSYLYRSGRSGELLELFFVSAISSLLIMRFILHLTGYPSLGGSHFHIAHMLWGGLLMAFGQILTFAFIGYRVQRLASFLGGIGFGLFIDELGKFITRSNDYFFQPTIALIYLVFVGLFLLFRSLGRRRELSQVEYLLNALSMTEEAVINDLDDPERNRVLNYLILSDPKHPIVKPLQEAMAGITPVKNSVSLTWQWWLAQMERWYQRWITTRWGVTFIDVVFVTKSLLLFGLVAAPAVASIFEPTGEQLKGVIWLQFISALLVTGYVVAGVSHIRENRLQAYELFLRSLLVDLFVTQFFAFYRLQFEALPVFLVNVGLYVVLQFLLHQERRVRLREAS